MVTDLIHKYWKRLVMILAAAAELVYLLLFFACNFAVVFPGAPMDLLFIIGVALLPIINLGVLRYLARKGLLTAKTAVGLTILAVLFSSLYIIAGIQDLVRYLLTGRVRQMKGVVSLMLFTEEITTRVICQCRIRKRRGAENGSAIKEAVPAD